MAYTGLLSSLKKNSLSNQSFEIQLLSLILYESKFL